LLRTKTPLTLVVVGYAQVVFTVVPLTPCTNTKIQERARKLASREPISLIVYRSYT
jgi:hypothetical protein